MKFKILVSMLFLACVTVAAQEIVNSMSSFSQSEFCKNVKCELVKRDDSFLSTGTKYLYSIKNVEFIPKSQDIFVEVTRDVDLIYESKLQIDTSNIKPSVNSKNIYRNNLGLLSDFIKVFSGQVFSAEIIDSKCKKRSEDFPDSYTIIYSLLSKSKNSAVYCGVSEYYMSLTVTTEVRPEVQWDRNFLKNSKGIFTALPFNDNYGIGVDVFSIRQDQIPSFKYLVEITPIQRVKAEPEISERIKKIRLATANPIKFPIGSILNKDQTSKVVLPLISAGYMIFLQSNFKTFQTKTLKGVRYLEVGGQDWVTPTRDIYRYHFSGFTRDSKYHVHFTHEIATKILPKETGKDLDPNTPNARERVTKAFEIAAKKVNQAKPSDFEPSLDKLDAFVNTLSVTSAK
jgi:hypothetical protein